MIAVVSSATEWLALLIAAITACGLMWRKVFRPIAAFVRSFQAWMARIESSISLVEEHMKPNSGSTLMDKANQANESARLAADVADNNAAQIKALDRKVTKLLTHDQERDQPGLRYGTTEENE